MIVRFMLGRLLLFLAGAGPLMLMTAARAQDLAAHCAAVGNDDRVKPIPMALVPAARQAFGMGPNEPDAALQAGTVFRCMGGQVWLCNHGANLTCAKGDVRRVSEGATAYCRDHPGADMVAHVCDGPRHDLQVGVRRERAAHHPRGQTGLPRVLRQPVEAAGKVGVAFALGAGALTSR